MEADRRAALLGAKLGALVHDGWSGASGRAGTFPDGATLVDGDRGWVLVGDDGARRLGSALAWARQQRAGELHLLAEDPAVAGVLARRAGRFARPPQVWVVDGRSVQPAEPAPVPVASVPPPSAELFRPVLADAGLEVVVEQGTLLAEVNGLEVARVVPSGGDGDARMEVGVGRFDREAFAMINADLRDTEALAKAVGIVRSIRRPDSPRHQLNQLAPERWLRADHVADPSPLGLSSLEPVEPVLPRQNLRDRAVASAIGEGADGRPVLVTFSSGVDLELVPAAADDRAMHAPDARLVLAVPARDVHPVTEALAAALTEPAEVVAVEGGWQGR
ncbi:MAG: hypothetical protein JO291_04440 [Acidimicrobiia bacterium]|nr:hypothetical protein [Acidimicrobiia bacterium]